MYRKMHIPSDRGSKSATSKLERSTRPSWWHPAEDVAGDAFHPDVDNVYCVSI